MSDEMPPADFPSPNANVGCPNTTNRSLCRITQQSVVQQPVMNWNPIYDGNGAMMNSDPNTFVNTFQCETCNMAWEMTTVAGQSPAYRQLPNLVE